MFERFKDRARRVLVLGQEEARMLNHDYFGTEHILVGLIREGGGVAEKALEASNVHLDDVREQVLAIVGVGEGQLASNGSIPFTTHAKSVLEFSLSESLMLGHEYIDTEHILLGLIRGGEGVAVQLLVRLGVDPNMVRHQVIRILAGYQGDGAGYEDRP